MAAQTKQQMRGTPEVDSEKVVPKAQRGSAKNKPGQVVQTKHEKRGRNWLRVFVSGVLTTDLVGGELMIFTAGLSEATTIHLAWGWGVVHVAALVAANYLMRKRE